MTRSAGAALVAEISAMRLVDVRVSLGAVLARALSVAAVATDDRFDAVRLTALVALLTVLHVVRLQRRYR